MAKVFISYKRDPSFALAKLISEKLKQTDIDVFLDVERMDSAEPFPKRLLREIENADVFICLLANSTLDAPWVQREIEHAYTMRKPMIPVFQESYAAPAEPLSHEVAALLDFQGVPVLDKRGLFVDESIAKLARMVKETAQAQTAPPILDTDDIDTEPIEQKPTVDDDPTQIGDRTFNLRPQTKSRRWLWLVVAVLIIVLGILLFQWVNGPIINAAVAGTQTAIAVAGVATETVSETPAPTSLPTCTPVPTPNRPVLTVGATGGVIYSELTSSSEVVANVAGGERLIITGISANSRNYYRVNHNGQEGWLGIFAVQEIEGDLGEVPVYPPPTIVIGDAGAPLHAGLETDTSLLATVPAGERLTVTGTNSHKNYYHVSYDGLDGAKLRVI
jgi:hypothetical protein